jgi:hypothetical protein
LWHLGALFFKPLVDRLNRLLSDNLIFDMRLCIGQTFGGCGSFFGRNLRLRLFVFNDLVLIVTEVAKDIIQDKVAIWLFRKDKGLHEFVMWL